MFCEKEKDVSTLAWIQLWLWLQQTNKMIIKHYICTHLCYYICCIFFIILFVCWSFGCLILFTRHSRIDKINRFRIFILMIIFSHFQLTSASQHLRLWTKLYIGCKSCRKTAKISTGGAICCRHTLHSHSICTRCHPLQSRLHPRLVSILVLEIVWVCLIALTPNANQADLQKRAYWILAWPSIFSFLHPSFTRYHIIPLDHQSFSGGTTMVANKIDSHVQNIAFCKHQRALPPAKRLWPFYKQLFTSLIRGD